MTLASNKSSICAYVPMKTLNSFGNKDIKQWLLFHKALGFKHIDLKFIVPFVFETSTARASTILIV